MTRFQRILAGLLAVQLLLTLLVYWPRSTGGNAAGPLFPELTGDDIMGLAIADDQGNTVELARRGSDWVLASGGDYPASAEIIAPILEKIVGLQTNRLVASSTASQRQLQVTEDSFLRRLEMALADWETEVLYVGSSPSAGATHIRRGGTDETYLTADLAIFELSATATNWIDPVYVNLDRETLSQLSLENANGTFDFVKAGDGSWSFDGLSEGETFAEGAFSTLLNRLVSLRLVRPLGTAEAASYGLGSPQAIVTVTSANGTQTLLVGAANPETGNYVVKWSDSPYYVEIAQFNGESLVNNTRDDFLIPPPTPEPTQTPVAPVESEPAQTPTP